MRHLEKKWLNLSLFKADKSQRSSIVSAILLLNKELYALHNDVWGYTVTS